MGSLSYVSNTTLPINGYITNEIFKNTIAVLGKTSCMLLDGIGTKNLTFFADLATPLNMLSISIWRVVSN
jgi:hypothetical protein